MIHVFARFGWLINNLNYSDKTCMILTCLLYAFFPTKKTLQKQSVLNLSSIYFPIVVKLYKNMTYDSYMLIWSTLIHVPAAPELQNLTKTCIRLHHGWYRIFRSFFPDFSLRFPEKILFFPDLKVGFWFPEVNFSKFSKNVLNFPIFPIFTIIWMGT